jgi:CO/xanthine dehydrogenase Mo-binding subunit
MQKAAEQFGWKQKYHAPGAKTLPDGRLHGVGMCHIVSEKGSGSPGRTTIIRANPDGSFHANFGIGRASSGTSSALCALIAETLGTSYDKVNCTVGDSVVSGYGGSQAGSQGTNANGWGAYDAAVAIRDAMFTRAASTLKTTVDQLDTKDGKIFLKSDPTKSVTHADAVGGNCVIRYGDGTKLGSGLFRDMGQWKVGQATTIRTYNCQMVEIAVDPETGDIEVLDWVLVNDVGRALFPDGVIHQIEGSMIMQLGIITAWEQLFDPTTGATINGTFIDQKNPTSLDIPITKMKGSYYESNNNSSPYGVMGVGEPPIIPYVAFHNAFFNATGKRIGETTIGPARALKALGKI